VPLLLVYCLSGAALVALAVSRYVTPTPRDRLAALIVHRGRRSTSTATLRRVS
jgi:hypothetical protein